MFIMYVWNVCVWVYMCIIGKSKISITICLRGKKGPAVVIVPDEPREVFICGCAAASAVSQAVCKAAAIAKRVPLYEHIASIRCHEVSQRYLNLWDWPFFYILWFYFDKIMETYSNETSFSGCTNFTLSTPSSTFGRHSADKNGSWFWKS